MFLFLLYPISFPISIFLLKFLTYWGFFSFPFCSTFFPNYGILSLLLPLWHSKYFLKGVFPMFTLKQREKDRSNDATSYVIVLDKIYTVRTFIATLLYQYPIRWGAISIQNPMACCCYRNGVLETYLDNALLEKTVSTVTASRSGSRMDYLIKV